VVAAVGLPGLGDFVGEFLVLLGAYRVNVSLTVIASLGIIAATLYGLKVSSQVFQGPNRHNWILPDLLLREWVIFGCMMASLFWVGLYPQSFIRTFQPFPESPERSIALLPPGGR
jgi:NADH-quinone oxidoreductase subunit M